MPTRFCEFEVCTQKRKRHDNVQWSEHNVEDNLTSIRTSIADRSPGDRFERREAHVTTLRGRSFVADEAIEFELPAIFKTSAATRCRTAQSSGAPQRSSVVEQTARPEPPAHRNPVRSARGHMIEPPPVAREPVIDAKPVATGQGRCASDGVKRVMAPFCDTRIDTHEWRCQVSRRRSTSTLRWSPSSPSWSRDKDCPKSQPAFTLAWPLGAHSGVHNDRTSRMPQRHCRPILRSCG